MGRARRHRPAPHAQPERGQPAAHDARVVGRGVGGPGGHEEEREAQQLVTHAARRAKYTHAHGHGLSGADKLQREMMLFIRFIKDVFWGVK